jgi:hypothetical protein
MASVASIAIVLTFIFVLNLYKPPFDEKMGPIFAISNNLTALWGGLDGLTYQCKPRKRHLSLIWTHDKGEEKLDSRRLRRVRGILTG